MKKTIFILIVTVVAIIIGIYVYKSGKSKLKSELPVVSENYDNRDP